MNEFFPRRNWIFSLISILGVVMIIRPKAVFERNEGGIDITGHAYTHSGRFMGVIVCLFQSLLLAINLLMIKISGKRVHPMTLIVIILITSLVLSPFMAYFNGFSSLSLNDIYYIVLMGIAYFCS